MEKYILGYFVVINILSFSVWGIDKWKAIKSKWRISEKYLLILTILGGFIGGMLGMQLFRHKTIKSKFLYAFWAIVFLWLIIAIVLLMKITIADF